jgi:hypothetical protein
MTRLKLRQQYAEKSKKFDYPEQVDEAIENDYVRNSNLYVGDIFEYIETLCLLCPDITPELLLKKIRDYDTNGIGS